MKMLPKPLSECLAEVGTPIGRAWVAKYLRSRPFPHYKPVPGAQEMLLRIAADGKRTMGWFVNREFIKAAQGTG